MHRFAQTLALCAAIVFLCGCHGHDDAAGAKNADAPKAAPAKTRSSKPAAAPSPAASTTAPASSSTTAKSTDDDILRVSSVTLGTAIDGGYAVTAPATRFSADTHTIYASVATSGRTASARLDARWRYLQGQGVLVNELGQNIAADGPAVTTFEVQNPNRWPAGRYTVEISLDGKQVAQQDFEITDGK